MIIVKNRQCSNILYQMVMEIIGNINIDALVSNQKYMNITR